MLQMSKEDYGLLKHERVSQAATQIRVFIWRFEVKALDEELAVRQDLVIQER